MTWTLHRGDCLDPETGLVTLAHKSVDVTITDPPFDRHTHSRGGSVVRYDGGPNIAKIPFAPLESARPVADQITRLTKRWSLVFCAVRQIEEWAMAFEANGWNVPRVIIWHKPDASPQFSGDRPGHGYETIVLAHPVGRTQWNGGGKKGVYTVPRMDRETGFIHPTQKPIALLRQLVEDFSDPGELILDPFSGSATTLAAATQLGRRALGWERDSSFHELARRRLAGEGTREIPGQLTMFTRSAS